MKLKQLHYLVPNVSIRTQPYIFRSSKGLADKILECKPMLSYGGALVGNIKLEMLIAEHESIDLHMGKDLLYTTGKCQILDYSGQKTAFVLFHDITMLTAVHCACTADLMAKKVIEIVSGSKKRLRAVDTNHDTIALDMASISEQLKDIGTLYIFDSTNTELYRIVIAEIAE